MSDQTTDIEVLLVEDNPGDARLVEHHLQSPEISHFVEDLTLSHVTSIDEASDELPSRKYDVVLLDLGLPETSGLATLDRIKTLGADVPIIVLTGLDDRETALEAIERGAQDYLPKDELDGDRLVRALRYAVVRRRQQRALERKAEQMEFFNSVLRHDMLNGMTVIQSRSTALAEELEGEQAEFADTIVKWSDDIVALTRKVRSVLNTITSESEPELHPVELVPVLEQVCNRVESMDQDATIQLDVDESLVVHGDDLLADVIANLVMNAIEHGGESPNVTITGWTSDTDVVVRVADDGPGIPDDRKDSIFERGEKGAQSGGTGFGLYFVDAMIESYGGNVDIEASNAGGAAFVLELPAR